jgi:hypothetical protein
MRVRWQAVEEDEGVPGHGAGEEGAADGATGAAELAAAALLAAGQVGSLCGLV